MENINGVKVGITAFLAALTTMLGWFGWLTVLFVICMAADYLSGSAAALRHGEWSSAAARAGLWHKSGEIIAVAVAAGADFLIGLMTEMTEYVAVIQLPFEYTVLFCPLVLVWYILTELGSIIENAGRLTDNIPPFLKKAISVLKNAAEKGGEKMARETENTTE